MPQPRVGELIRERRKLAHRSQMDLAHDVGVSPRHLSFVELGKSRPSPELVELIGARLGLPLRERNDWLLAAGYAPRYPERPFRAETLAPVGRSLQALLDAHDPCPAMVIDRRWTVVLTNRAAIRLADGIADEVRGVPTNVFRIALHPDGFGSRTKNFPTWSAYLLGELAAAVERTQDPELVAVADEISGWPGITPRDHWARTRFDADADADAEPVVTWQVEIDGHDLSLFTTLSVLAAPLDVTLSELAIEMFFAADDATRASLEQLVGEVRSPSPTATP